MRSAIKRIPVAGHVVTEIGGLPKVREPERTPALTSTSSDWSTIVRVAEVIERRVIYGTSAWTPKSQ